MKVFIQTHTYLINMDHVAYLRADADGDNCIFKLTNGGQIIATCSYDLVIKELKDYQWARKDGVYDLNLVVITLDY